MVELSRNKHGIYTVLIILIMVSIINTLLSRFAVVPWSSAPGAPILYFAVAFMIAFTLWFGSILVYCLSVIINSTFQNRNLIVGLMSIYAAFVMLTGYGLGMIKSVVSRYLLKNKNETVKPAITREA